MYIPTRRIRPRVLLATLTGIALCIRLQSISRDNRVVWDETHLGRFSSKYTTNTFYLDVHPPLGKLLLTLLFHLFGNTVSTLGSFNFASGSTYPAEVPYTAVRIVQAVFGALLVPLTFALCRYLKLPVAVAWMAAVFVAVDSALVGISRIIVLDSMLLLANALVVFVFAYSRQALNGLSNSRRNISAAPWYWSLAMLGLTLGILCSPEADSMGSDFIVQMNGSALQIQPECIYDDSFVTIRSNGYPFEYLTTKNQSMASVQSQQQRILSTTKRFLVEDYFTIKRVDIGHSSMGKETISDGHFVQISVPKTRLFIVVSGGHQHNVQDYSVNLEADARNSVSSAWRIELVSKPPLSITTTEHGYLGQIRPIFSKFKLVSAIHNCELAIDYHAPLDGVVKHSQATGQYILKCLPALGTVWNIEHQLSTKDLPLTNISRTIALSFIKQTVTYNRLMRQINSMLVSDPDMFSAVESAPLSWPFLSQPMQLVTWSDDSQLKYLLIGNPVLWWSSAIFPADLKAGLCLYNIHLGR
ncbi:Protein O-mannosyltransferase 2 [Coemansia aciculifera]|nr:Protein O-mannosyltransferase 2 [Coemansia aciculifera]